MTDVTLGIRYDEDAEEVQVYAVSEGEEEILGTSGQDYFKSWVESYNEKHPEVKVVIQEVRPAEVQAEPIAAGPTALATPDAEPVLDKPAEV